MAIERTTGLGRPGSTLPTDTDIAGVNTVRNQPSYEAAQVSKANTQVSRGMQLGFSPPQLDLIAAAPHLQTLNSKLLHEAPNPSWNVDLQRLLQTNPGRRQALDGVADFNSKLAQAQVQGEGKLFDWMQGVDFVTTRADGPLFAANVLSLGMQAIDGEQAPAQKLAQQWAEVYQQLGSSKAEANYLSQVTTTVFTALSAVTLRLLTTQTGLAATDEAVIAAVTAQSKASGPGAALAGHPAVAKLRQLMEATVTQLGERLQASDTEVGAILAATAAALDPQHPQHPQHPQQTQQTV